MRSTLQRVVFCMLMCVLSWHGFSSAQNTGQGAANPMADPFGAAALSESAARTAARSALPAADPPRVATAPVAPTPRAMLPRSLRVLLISNNGTGLLSLSEPGAASMPVVHGKPFRILDMEFIADIDRENIRLLLPGGKLAWQGSLVGTSVAPLAADTSQLKYVPPLSAGVDPGLDKAASGRAAASNASPIVSPAVEVR